MDHLMVALTQFGGPFGVICLGSFLTFWLFYRGSHYQAGLVIFTIIGSVILNLLLKLVFVRDRPTLWKSLVTEKSFSFPSGHAMASMTLALMITWVFWYSPVKNLVMFLATGYVLIIGFGRLYLGVHYPSDVLMGWIVSLAWVAIIIATFAVV